MGLLLPNFVCSLASHRSCFKNIWLLSLISGWGRDDSTWRTSFFGCTIMTLVGGHQYIIKTTKAYSSSMNFVSNIE
ncbi:hypothetical protein GOP47_0018723 [Adiantum capillus-veneris]|uniref:Uncharacterized protein n=1 Tax=Adiantum capillus-veneris TaxID=13818 RepID=A0A9D4Z923_ADICA|nr:hypothetical protein GOP47_0018723 [Adiantum capillus-veneris]